MSSASERVNGRASGPVSTSGFLVILDLSAVVDHFLGVHFRSFLQNFGGKFGEFSKRRMDERTDGRTDIRDDSDTKNKRPDERRGKIFLRKARTHLKREKKK